jgi:hypothetical protein
MKYVFLTIFMFITLFLSAALLKLPNDLRKFAAAAVTYAVLSFVSRYIPIPIVGELMPGVGMYMVLIGSSYGEHEQTLKLVVVNSIIGALFFILIIARKSIV